MEHHASGDPSPPEESSETVRSGSVPGKSVRDAPYPPIALPDDAGELRNADVRPKTPQGPQRGPLGPTSRKTESSSKNPVDS